jgi:hypothetical protein
MAMSPRKMMAMGKSGEKKTKSAAKAPTTSPRAMPNPRRSDPAGRGNNQDKLEGQDYNEVLKGGGKRKMRGGGMVKKMRGGGMVKKMRGGGMVKK